MKNKLHKLCLKLRLYREIYNGHFNIGKTIIGTHFIYGDYVPILLKRCIELERGYHQESYMKMKHDIHKKAPKSSLSWMSGAGVGAAALLMASCKDIETEEVQLELIPPPDPIIVPDPPHS